jgi:hypothetical protein
MTDRPESSSDQPESTTRTNVSGGVNVEADHVNVGGDVVARDKVTYIGMSPHAVQRLVITVGVLVFATAACFFAGGLIVGASAINALQRKVDSNPVAGKQFETVLQEIAKLPSGQSAAWTFTEEQVSSYVRFILGPQIELTNGKARLLPDGRVVFYGSWSGFLNVPVMLVCSVQTTPGQLYKVEGAAFNLFAGPDTIPDLGWIPLPASTLQPLADQIGKAIGQNFRVVSVGPPAAPDASQPTATINIVRK